MCNEIIVDQVGSKPGDDSIYCDGNCSSWLHRRCAGLTKSAFDTISKSDNPFHCPHCKISLHEEEIKSLKNLVMNLSSHLSIVSDKLETVQKEMKEMSQVPSKPAQQISYAAAAGNEESNPAVNARAPAIDKSAISHRYQHPIDMDSSRKFNVIFHNVAESRTGTPRSQRQSQDLEKVVSICSTATDSIQADAVSDLFRLGKYRKDQKRPRPILAKFSYTIC